MSRISLSESQEIPIDDDCVTSQALNIERKKAQAKRNSYIRKDNERYFFSPALLEIDLTIDHNQVKQIFTYDCDNWFGIMLSMYGRTFPWPPLTVVLIFTVLYILVDSKYEFCILGEGMSLNFNPLIHSTVGIVMGFLIVYQSSQSSARWWEGRVAWENIISNSRESMRILCSHCNGRELIKLFGRYMMAFSIVSKHYLLTENFSETNPCPELAKIMEREDLEKLYMLSSRSRPMACLYAAQRMTELAIQKKLFPRPVARDINPRLVILADNLGACERILYTPMPWVYTLHLRMFILLYLIMLPTAFSDYRPTPGWQQTISYVLLTAYAFLGLEDMAVQIQNPFGDSFSDLPLTIFNQIIQDDIEDVVRLKYEQYNRKFTNKLESAVSKSEIRERAPWKEFWNIPEYKPKEI